MTHIKEEPGLHLLLPYNMTCSLIYFRRWVMLSGTSITATSISPLELVRQYQSGMSPKSRHGRGRNALLTWCFLSLSAVLGAFSWTGFLFLNNKFVWNELSASPQGASLSLSVWHSLHLSCWLLSFPASTCIHLISLRTSTEGEICNFKSRTPPFLCLHSATAPDLPPRPFICPFKNLDFLTCAKVHTTVQHCHLFSDGQAEIMELCLFCFFYQELKISI